VQLTPAHHQPDLHRQQRAGRSRPLRTLQRV